MEKSDGKQEMKKSMDSGGVMSANGLKYLLPSNISLNTSRAYQQNFADQQSYQSNSGTELVVRLQSSQGFCYGPNSYLSFDVLATGLVVPNGTALALGFNKGDATALFSRYLLESKDGQEIERVEQNNIAVQNCLPWQYPRNYEGVREMAGAPNSRNVEYGVAGPYADSNTGLLASAVFIASGADPQTYVGTKLRVCIPLSYFSGLFSCHSLIPSNLISGMLFRLTLENAQRALSVIQTSLNINYNPAGINADNLIFTITDPVINCDMHNLSPVVAKNIMEMSQKGLPYPYTTKYNQLTNVNGASSVVVQVNKAVSRASRVWTIPQSSEAASNDSIYINNLGTTSQCYRSVQTRIGSLYMPFQPINVPNADLTAVANAKNCAQIYINNLQALKAVGPDGWHQHDPAISKNDFAGIENANVTNGNLRPNAGRAVYIQTLEQSAPLAYSGVSINNSRTCEQRIEFGAAKPNSLELISFLEYVKVAVVYPVRTIIKE